MSKDACYNKVKSRYKVFPSAYASGALAKCRKVGASNWGNSSKKAMGGVIQLNNGGFIANGCGTVQQKRRKKTRIF